MAVIVHEMNVEAAEPSTPPPAGAPAPGGTTVDEPDFLALYGEYVRRLVREEIERALRLAAE